MGFRSVNRYCVILAVTVVLSACSGQYDSGESELIFRGQSYPSNVLIIRNGHSYFGDDATIPQNLPKLYRNDGDCVDAGLIAFSLNTNTAQCGNYSFVFTKRENGAVRVRGTCVRADARKCYPDQTSPTSVEYILTGADMPHQFRFYVKDMFDDTFQMADSK